MKSKRFPKSSFLTGKNYSLVPIFDKDVYTYNVFVEDDIDNIMVELNLEDGETCLNDNLSFVLEEGINKLKLVTKNKQLIKTYCLNVIKGNLDSYNSSALLYDLKINDVDFKFTPNIFYYKVYTTKDINNLELTYVPYNPKSYVSVSTNNNFLNIVVESVDKKNESKYTLEVINDKPVFNQKNNIKSKFKKVTKKEKTLIVFSLILFFLISSFLIFKLLF